MTLSIPLYQQIKRERELMEKYEEWDNDFNFILLDKIIGLLEPISGRFLRGGKKEERKMEVNLRNANGGTTKVMWEVEEGKRLIESFIRIGWQRYSLQEGLDRLVAMSSTYLSMDLIKSYVCHTESASEIGSFLHFAWVKPIQKEMLSYFRENIRIKSVSIRNIKKYNDEQTWEIQIGEKTNQFCLYIYSDYGAVTFAKDFSELEELEQELEKLIDKAECFQFLGTRSGSEKMKIITFGTELLKKHLLYAYRETEEYRLKALFDKEAIKDYNNLLQRIYD